jgi:hypothetical protein
VVDTVSASEDAIFTMRNRRLPAVAPPLAPSRFAVGDVRASPAQVTRQPAPYGDLSKASIEDIVTLATEHVGSQERNQVGRRRRGTRKLLSHLLALPGKTWQERWLESDFHRRDCSVEILTTQTSLLYELRAGAQALFCLRVVTPSLLSLQASKLGDYQDHFGQAQRDPLLHGYYRAVDESQGAEKYKRLAKRDVAAALTTQGIEFADLTPDALLFYALECRRLRLHSGRGDVARHAFTAVRAWDTLFNCGHFPPDTPPSLRSRLTVGQLTAEQLVDRYAINNEGVRQLLIDYLRRRQVDKYNTRTLLAGHLVGNFWSKIEELAPTQADLHLSNELYEQWKAAIRTTQHGKPRADIASVLLPVRAFYLDIQSWALDEPERWGPWAAPCPIPSGDLRGFSARRRRIKERMDDRTRVRQPLLPKLVMHVEQRLEGLSSLLAAARSVELGDEFAHDGRRFRRTRSNSDRWNHAGGNPTVRVEQIDSGEVVDVLVAEEAAFWEWAYVEVLRHTGIRVEELVELSHTSVRQYQRPNGEVVPLLIVAPSKSDRERVIPMSPELFHVVACIVRRQTSGGVIPPVARYDPNERKWTLPLPYLFQRTRAGIPRVVSPATVLNNLRACCERIAASDPQFVGVQVTPHDFRRLFATELVNNGLPIHIGAALLGHLNIETTRGYTAVFNEDVVRHYQQFLASRRSQRPQEEYRPTSPREWAEFEEHFDKRKVELGSCGRPYGSPCAHEHACIRCPMLHVDERMIRRLDDIESDLLSRRARAESEGWLGELEGLDLTLRYLADKRAESQRLSRVVSTVTLGMPTLRREAP